MFTKRDRAMLYDYLIENYGENTPIFVSELNIEGLNESTLRVQIKKLTDAGKLKRFDTSVYFISKKSIFPKRFIRICTKRGCLWVYLHEDREQFADAVRKSVQHEYNKDYSELIGGEIIEHFRKENLCRNED